MSEMNNQGVAPHLTRHFERVVNWLELQQPLPDDVMAAIRERFVLAAENPDSSYFIVATNQRAVQMFGGKAVCVDIPDGEDANDELKRAFGAPFLEWTNVFAAFLCGLDERYREMFARNSGIAYREALPERRLDIVN